MTHRLASRRWGTLLWLTFLASIIWIVFMTLQIVTGHSPTMDEYLFGLEAGIVIFLAGAAWKIGQFMGETQAFMKEVRAFMADTRREMREMRAFQAQTNVRLGRMEATLGI
jgi:hypothetical protein